MAKNNLKTINYNTVDKSNDKDVGFTASKSNDIKIQQKKFETYLANSYNFIFFVLMFFIRLHLIDFKI